MSAIRRRQAGAFLLTCTCLALLSVAIGRGVVETEAIDASALQIGLAAVAAAVALAVMLAGPVPCVAAIAAATVMQFLPELAVGGGVDLVVADAFFGALACWWLVRPAEPVDNSGVPPLRSLAVVVLLAYVGLSLLYVAVVDPGRLSVSFVSWIRLVQTVAVGFLAASFLRTRTDVVMVLAAIALAGSIDIAVALAGGVGEAGGGPLGTRGGGVVDPNTLGLVAGLLILMGTFGALGRSTSLRVLLALWGVVGVVQSRSVGAIVGTSVAVVLGLAFSVPAPRRMVAADALRVVTTLVVAVAVAYGIAAVVRPENLPTSERFGQSSTAQRAVLGAAGLELAERHPLIGVGWRRSEEPSVIGDPGLNTELRARFPTTKAEFFPDVTPGSVHNAYIQVAADLGLIGVVLLVIVFVSLGRQIKAVLARARGRSPAWPQLWFLTWGLVLIVIWWNDNPIFGGQAETVLAVIFVGAIAGVSRALPSRAPTARSEIMAPEPQAGRLPRV